MTQTATSAATAEPSWPMPQRPGPETEALKRFHQDVTWTGMVKANGPVPEMTAQGRGIFRWVCNGLWLIGEFYQEQFREGRKVTEWSAHHIAGWDYSRRRYVAFAADSNGRAVPFRLAAILLRSTTREFPRLDHFGIEKTAPREVAKAVSDYFSQVATTAKTRRSKGSI